MKILPKLPVLIISALLIINTSGCSNKNTPAPSNDDASKVAIVYNESNRTAQFPTTGMVSDAAGDLYIADPATNTIKMITPKGVVSTIVGSGTFGSANGTGIAASFALPSGLAIDAANNIYVADAANNIIRKISPAGVVTTIAGSGAVGSANGTGTAASFNFPQGIAVDNSGNIYVADTGNDLIRKITPGGVVSTLAGKIAAGSANGTGTQATFNIPQGLAIDNSGNLYIADAANNLIRKIASSGVVSTFAGSGYADSADGIGTTASINFPDALTFDGSGNLYTTEVTSNNVCKIAPNGMVTRIDVSGVPSFADGFYPYNSIPHPGGLYPYPHVRRPNGLTIDYSYHVYVADYGNNLIRESVNQ